MTDKELYEKIVKIIEDNSQTVSGYGMVIDGPETIAQLIMNEVVEELNQTFCDAIFRGIEAGLNAGMER